MEMLTRMAAAMDAVCHLFGLILQATPHDSPKDPLKNSAQFVPAAGIEHRDMGN